jgi:hypothetical protein
MELCIRSEAKRVRAMRGDGHATVARVRAREDSEVRSAGMERVITPFPGRRSGGGHRGNGLPHGANFPSPATASKGRECPWSWLHDGAYSRRGESAAGRGCTMGRTLVGARVPLVVAARWGVLSSGRVNVHVYARPRSCFAEALDSLRCGTVISLQLGSLLRSEPRHGIL